MVVIYVAIFIILTILLVHYLSKYSEYLEDKIGTNAEEIYTAGATMRVIGQAFSSADQDTRPRQYNILDPEIHRDYKLYEMHRDQIKELNNEHMVNEARAPEFWELNPILGQFKEEIMRV
jgi:hypothetical protein